MGSTVVPAEAAEETLQSLAVQRCNRHRSPVDSAMQVVLATVAKAAAVVAALQPQVVTHQATLVVMAVRVWHRRLQVDRWSTLVVAAAAAEPTVRLVAVELAVAAVGLTTRRQQHPARPIRVAVAAGETMTTPVATAAPVWSTFAMQVM